MSIIHSSGSALVFLRVVAAILIFIHGVARIVLGGVVPFGGFLTTSNLPFGYGLAWMVTVIETVGTPVLASGRYVRALSLYYAGELILGILLVHARDGWFVVGAAATVLSTASCSFPYCSRWHGSGIKDGHEVVLTVSAT